MTRHKMYELMDKYETRLKEAGYTVPVRQDGDEYSVFDAANRERVGAHLLWMVQEAKKTLHRKGPKSFRWLGWIQHGMVDLGLYTLTQLKDHSKNEDEYRFEPPEGMQTTQAKVLFTFACAHCGNVIFRMGRDTWLPTGHHISYLRFPKSLDPDERLPKLQDVGIHIDYFVHAMGWDFGDLSYSVILRPTMLHPTLTDESIAIAVSLMRAAGWSYAEDADKAWAEKWAKHHDDGSRKNKANPDCPCPHGQVIMGPQIVEMLSGEGDEEEDESPKPKPKKKRKKGDKKDGEEGSPDAGGKKG